MTFRSTAAAAGLTAALFFTVIPPIAAAGWLPAEGERTWSFPRDHGLHEDYRTEWWYFTGQLKTPTGRLFGYQLTFFRFGAAQDPRPEGNPWAVRDLYAGHFALTDAEGESFSYAERLSRAGPGLAGAGGTGMDVVLLDWSVTTAGEEIVLRARDDDMKLSLRLKSREDPLLHGSGGLSLKGSRRGQASWYYSLTDLSTKGEVQVPGMDAPLSVEGWSWFDHEFGSNQLSAEQVGWDWFALRLDDGRRIMLYLLRRDDGTIEPLSSGTLRERDGTTVHLDRHAFTVEATETWRSARSGAVYPAGWRIKVPAAAIDLALTPVLPDQELVTGRSTGVTYWEGAVTGSGRSGGADVTADGYIELTGYGGSLGGLF